MQRAAVPDPTCPGCLGDGRCWVCLGRGRLQSAGALYVECHVCGGSAVCATCATIAPVVDLVAAEPKPQPAAVGHG